MPKFYYGVVPKFYYDVVDILRNHIIHQLKNVTMTKIVSYLSYPSGQVSPDLTDMINNL